MGAESSDEIVLPNRGNLWVLILVFSPGTLFIPGIAIYRGEYFNADIWLIALCAHAATVLAYFYIKSQRVVLSDHSITHGSFGISGSKVKTLNLDDIEYWRIERLTLIVARKEGNIPDLPHGPFADLSDVLLIPASLFSPRTKEITDFLTGKGIQEKK